MEDLNSTTDVGRAYSIFDIEIGAKRFITKRGNQQFELYIGDSHAAEVHHENHA